VQCSCPACRNVSPFLDELAGQKVFCPRCGQKLLLPAAVKTVLAGEVP
jgi:hypothetical protein